MLFVLMLFGIAWPEKIFNTGHFKIELAPLFMATSILMGVASYWAWENR